MKRISIGRLSNGLLVAMVPAVVCLGCGSPGKVGDPSVSGSGGGGAGGVTIDLTSQGGVAGSPVGGGGGAAGAGSTSGLAEGTCGETTITPNRAPVDIFIVLDRSGSMSYSIADDCYCTSGVTAAGSGGLCRNTTNCTDRWTAVTQALTQAVNANPSINWGLEFYSSPGGADCSVGLVPQVPISATSGTAILSQMGTVSPGNHTPTAAAMNVATMYVQRVADGNSKAILLATDGLPNCVGGRVNGDDDMPATINAVAGAYAAGIPVYVVGMGPQESIANLSQLAQYGGTNQYYPADSVQALSDALAAISKIVSTTCAFQAPTLAPDDSKVYVYVDKVLVQQSVDNGWIFGATSADIVLTGTYCENMLAGITSQVQIIFGCKDYVPPAIIP